MRLRITVRSPARFELELLFDDESRDSIGRIDVSHIPPIDVPIIESVPGGLGAAMQLVTELIRVHYQGLTTSDDWAVQQQAISDGLLREVAGSCCPDQVTNPIGARNWAIATLIRMPDSVSKSDFDAAVSALESLAKAGDAIAVSFIENHLDRVISMRRTTPPDAGGL